MVELIDHAFAADLGWQSDVQRSLESAHAQLPKPAQADFAQRFGNAEICVTFRRGMTANRVHQIIFALLSELLVLQDDFEGEVSAFSSARLRRVAESVEISRGKFCGPIFSVTCIGGIGDPLLPSIQRKLEKTYSVPHPVELLGYLDVAVMLPFEEWKEPTAQFLRALASLGPFRRIWIVDVRNGSVQMVHPVE